MCRNDISVLDLDVNFDVELPSEVKATENTSLTLTATLSRDRPVVWSKNGTPIASDDTHYQITSTGTTHTLTVNNAVLEDQADYSLMADQKISQTHVIVEGKKTF